jgi:hypothetical protein
MAKKKLKDHDIFVRGIFQYPELVMKILNFAIPTDLKTYIDFSTLSKTSDVHISEKLKATYSDTLYEAALNKTSLSEEAQNDPQLPSFRFCFLGEFKSSKPNEPIDFQIEDYVRSIQRLDIKSNLPPSIVIPIVIYHGKDKWEHKRLHDVFSKYLPQTILDYIAFPKYILIDLHAMSDAEIAQAIGLAELRSAFIALKHAQEKKFFKQNLSEILKFVDSSSPSILFQTYLSMLLEYSERRSGLEAEEFAEIFEQFNNNEDMGTDRKSFLEIRDEKTLQKGIEKGIEKGIRLLINTSNLSDSQIAAGMEVSVELVYKIRSEMSTLKLGSSSQK